MYPDVGIILQARMGSQRLAGKVLKKIHSRTLLEHIFLRLKCLEYPARVVLATSTHPRDDILESFCLDRRVDCFRGSESDVLERYFLCARQYRFTNIVRLTADNPFVDVYELKNLIELHLSSGADYSHSFGVLPVGTGAEVFTFDALKRSFYSGTKENHREHVNEYIQEYPELFKIRVLSVPREINHPDVRLTVDTEEDYRKACFIVEQSKEEYITTKEAIRLCTQFV